MMKNKGVSHLFWIEFVIMVGVLLLIVAMTLVGIKEVHEVNKDNQTQIETSIALQNMMEYCKINRADIEASIEKLGGIGSQEEEQFARFILYYDDTWKAVMPVQKAVYSMELRITTKDYTCGKLRDIALQGYEIEHYNVEQHGTNGNGKKLILTLEGSCVIGEGEV